MWFLLALGSFTSGFAQNQSSGARMVLINSLNVSGTQIIDSVELAEITGALAGSEFIDDSEELQERLRNEFQDHGYFQVEVQKFEIKVIDPLASPKPVRIEAQVSEGPLCRLSNIEFTGNHFLGSEELRTMFPLKTGDVFKKAAVAGGLETMMKAFGARGILEATAVPRTNFDSNFVRLSIELDEGPQFRMGKLEIIGPAEAAAKLQARWQLEPGEIFNTGYVKNFIEENSSLLPADFTESAIKRLRDCGSSTVAVHVYLAADGQHEAQDRAKEEADCREEAKQHSERKQ
jgi:outer membrane protein assembly factor BamA